MGEGLSLLVGRVRDGVGTEGGEGGLWVVVVVRGVVRWVWHWWEWFLLVGLMVQPISLKKV